MTDREASPRSAEESGYSRSQVSLDLMGCSREARERMVIATEPGLAVHFFRYTARGSPSRWRRQSMACPPRSVAGVLTWLNGLDDVAAQKHIPEHHASQRRSSS